MTGIIFLFILFQSASRLCGAFTPKDHYILSCGTTNSSSASDAFDNRIWYPDENSNFSSSFSSTFTALANHDASAPGGPFTAARIFKSNFTYTFPVSPGPYFLRLFFYPGVYSGNLDVSHFLVTAQANDILLLRNFSAQLAVNYIPFTQQEPNTPDLYVIKEYYVTVPNSHNFLKLTFAPTPPSSFAFVNGIEIVSVPDDLYISDKDVRNVENPSVPFQITNTSALETAYRINVGGSDVMAEADGKECGMYRQWKNDEPYIISIHGTPGQTNVPIMYTEQVPNYTAPETVYQTFKELGFDRATDMKLNLTWRFKMDPGFYYMLRLHWCEDRLQVNTTFDIGFEVYINNLTVENGANVMAWTDNKKYQPFYRDYIVQATGVDGGIGGSGDIWIALHPTTQFQTSYSDVLLNGLEIFKINRTDGSLDAPNPQVSLHSRKPSNQVETKPRNQTHLLPAVIGGSVAGIVLISLLAWILIFQGRKAKKESSTFGASTDKTGWLFFSYKSGSKTTGNGSTLPSHLCRRFSLAQIKLATNDFSEALIVGRGGFGSVYRGVVDGEKGLVTVAIKRLNPSSKQGVHEFRTEIEMLSKLRHVHLVSLIGYCDDSGEMILVYEYMDRGTLRDHLYNTDIPPLSWNQRLNASLGAAKGLHYLHAGASQMIIHRDVKSTNILLDEKWVSKVSDFGLSKLGPIGGDLSHVSTAVKGSFGYVDPEYYKFQRLTEKSDVYSFGVVLFEILCGRAAVNPSLPKEQVNLAVWARSYQRKGALEVIVDPNIRGEIGSACLRKFGEIAEMCVRDHGTDRPSMADVFWSLEFALELQQKAGTLTNIVHDKEVLPSTTVTPETVTAEPASNSAATATATATSDDGFNFSSTSGERMARTNSSSALITSGSLDYGESTSVTVFSEIFKPQGR